MSIPPTSPDEISKPLDAPEGVYARSVRSGWWYGMSLVAQKFLSLVGFLVLVRMLAPEDYGAIAAMFVVTGLFDQFTTIPFGDALVQRNDNVEKYMDPWWTWDLLRTAVIAILIAIFAGPIADYFGMTGMARTLMPWTGLFLVLPSFGNPRYIYFHRRLDMRFFFIRDVISQIVYILSAMGYALFVDASLVALFVGHMARFATGVIVNNVLSPRPFPRLSFSFGRLRDLMGFGGWAYGHSMVEYITGVADRIVVGGLMGVERLGLYTRARDLSLTAGSMLASALDKVGMSAFARVQDKQEKLRQGFLKSLDVFAMAPVPFSLALLMEGGTVIPLVLGEQWIAIVLPLKIFSVGALAFGLTYILQPMFTGIGRPDLAFKLRLLQVIVTVPLLYVLGASRGPIGLALAVSFGWIVTLIFGAWKARPLLRYDKRDLLPLVLSTVAASLAMLVVDVLGRGPVHTFRSWWLDLLWVAVLGAVYFAALLLSSRMIGGGPFETARTVVIQLWLWAKSRFPILGRIDKTA